MQRLAVALVAAALAACVAVAPGPAPSPANGPAKSRGHGPPPHAPAHGYRAKTPQGVEIVFDTALGVYVVVELPAHYWLDDRYYRRDAKSGWTVGVSLDGPWTACADADLPPGLRAGARRGKDKGKNGNGKGNGGR
jgi:hypothetical protein